MFDPLSNNPDDWEYFLNKYWEIIGQRSLEVRNREKWYLTLPSICKTKNPPQFTREEIVEILIWKHTDPRWRIKALEGLNKLTDKEISDITTIALSEQIPLVDKIRKLTNVYGWGIATASAILTAGRPDMYGVLDVNVLSTLRNTINEWRYIAKIDKHGNPNLSKNIFLVFTDWIRNKANLLSGASNKRWTPREVEMALWAAGATMGDFKSCIDSDRPERKITINREEIVKMDEKEYVQRLINGHMQRGKPKTQEHLTLLQQQLHTIIKLLSATPHRIVSNKDINSKYNDVFHSKLNLLPTDFCYNKVNIAPDFEAKYLLYRDMGEYEFVDFNWQANERPIEILWVPKGSGVPGVLKGRLFKVGIYYNGIYSWDFETELKEYI
jgi:hypothetical protein